MSIFCDVNKLASVIYFALNTPPLVEILERVSDTVKRNWKI